MKALGIIIMAIVFAAAPACANSWHGGDETTNNYYTTNNNPKANADATAIAGATAVANTKATAIAAPVVISNPSAIAGQKQGQGQGQEQDQRQGQTQLQNNTMRNSFNTYQQREFVDTGIAQQGQLVPYYGPQQKNEAVIDVAKLLLYHNRFTEGMLIKALTDANVMCKWDQYNEGIEAVKADVNGDKWIQIIVSEGKIAGNYTVAGFVAARARNGRTNSLEVVLKAAYEALQRGCTTLHVVGQGAIGHNRSTGWGVGLNYSGGHMSQDQLDGNVYSGGPGYSSGKAWNEHHPWVQAFGLVER